MYQVWLRTNSARMLPGPTFKYLPDAANFMKQAPKRFRLKLPDGRWAEPSKASRVRPRYSKASQHADEFIANEQTGVAADAP